MHYPVAVSLYQVGWLGMVYKRVERPVVVMATLKVLPYLSGYKTGFCPLE